LAVTNVEDSAGAAGTPTETPSKSNGENIAINANAASSGDSRRTPLVYSKQMLMSLRETEHCVCKPEGFPDMSIKIKTGRGGGGGRRGMDRRQSLARGGGYDNQGSRGGGGDQWSRGSDTTRKQNTVAQAFSLLSI